MLGLGVLPADGNVSRLPKGAPLREKGVLCLPRLLTVGYAPAPTPEKTGQRDAYRGEPVGARGDDLAFAVALGREVSTAGQLMNAQACSRLDDHAFPPIGRDQ